MSGKERWALFSTHHFYLSYCTHTEVNPQVRAIRVTCRAVHATVASALVNTIKALVT